MFRVAAIVCLVTIRVQKCVVRSAGLYFFFLGVMFLRLQVALSLIKHQGTKARKVVAVAPRIPNLDIKRRWAVSFTDVLLWQLCLTNRNISGPQTQVDELGKKEILALARNRSTLSHNPFRSLVICTTATELSCLFYSPLTVRVLDTQRSVQSLSILTFCARSFSSIEGSSLHGCYECYGCYGCYTPETGKQLSTFYARSKNCEKRLLASSCLSVCPSVPLSFCLQSVWNNSAPTGRIFMIFFFFIFLKSVEKFQA